MLTPDRIKDILTLYIRNEMDEFDSETIYGNLADWCGCSDEEITELGFGSLIPQPEDKLRIEVYDLLIYLTRKGLDESDGNEVKRTMLKLNEILKAAMVKLYMTDFYKKIHSAYAEFCRFSNSPGHHLDVGRVKTLLCEALGSAEEGE